MRKLMVIVLTLLIIFFVYLYAGNQHVSVIDAHYDGSTAKIIVDKLPFTESKKIDWWIEHQEEVLKKYAIPSGVNRPFLIVVYAFGNGYVAEDKEDRLCFSDIKPPKNCIDKNILMLIWRTRDGGVKYEF